MLRPSRRALKIFAGVVLVLAVVGAIILAALPEIVRRVAVDQAFKLTGRTVTLDDADLNVFTGHLALKGLKVIKPGVNERAVEVERLDVRVNYLPLFRHDVRVTELTLMGATVNIVRRGPVDFDFSDILDRLRGDASVQSSKPAAGSEWTVTLDRVSVRRLKAAARDLTTSPESAWRLDDLTLDARGLTTRRAAPPGRLETKLKLNGAPIAVTSDSFVLKPLAVSGRVTIDGFDLAQVRPYIPPTVPAAPHTGKASAAMALAVELEPSGLKRGTVKGDVTLDGLEVFQTGRTEPFFKVARLGVKIREADLVARSVVIGALELEAPAVRAVRDAREKIDLVALGDANGAAASAGPAASAAPQPARATSAAGAQDSGSAAGPPPADFKLRVEQVSLRKGGITFRDEAVKPVNTLLLTDLSADVKDVSWPPAGPAGFAVSMKMPKSGRVEMKGSVTPLPFDIDFDLSLRDGSIEPFQPYIPVKARFVGTFHGDNRNHITLSNGTLTATSRGKNWIDKFAILAPGEKTPAASFDRLRLDGIDFSWPKYAKVSRISLTKPDIRVERDRDGVISLKKLFEPDPAKAVAPKTDSPKSEAVKAETPKKDASTPKATPETGPIPIPVEIGMFVIEEGHAQFVDRTTTPPFTESISRLALTIEGFSSTPGRRARISTQAVIGGTSAFDLKGEIAPFGEVYADLAGELRDFKLTSVNPYADPMIAWAMKTGQLALKVHYRVEKNQLTADNEIIVRNLTVAPTRQSDEVKKKIGLPLGMIVALITDADNGIHVNVPLSGELNQVKAGIGDAIWTALKNALTNVVAAPFRSINKLFKGPKGDSLDELQVDPVTFAAGSADVAPEMGKHLSEVAGFLRKAPMIKFALAPVAAPRDLESLKEQEVTLKIQRLQKERGLPDFSAAVAVAFKEELPGVKPPQSGEAQLAALREREPAPDARLTELLERRVAAVREALTKTEGIPAERLVPGTAQPPASDEAAEGRIEFQIEQ
jgi:Domain of Unknown Function (DUF748)